MLAIIFSVLSAFFFTGESNNSVELRQTNFQLDSIKRPLKNRPAQDSTARFLRVDRIFIVGNRITRDQIILRELSLKQGDVIYSADIESILELDRKKLINTRLFNTVNLRTLELESGNIDIVIDLKERW